MPSSPENPNEQDRQAAIALLKDRFPAGHNVTRWGTGKLAVFTFSSDPALAARLIESMPTEQVPKGEYDWSSDLLDRSQPAGDRNGRD